MRPSLADIVGKLEQLTYVTGTGTRPGYVAARIGVAELIMGATERATNWCLYAMREDPRWWDLAVLVGQWHDDSETEEEPWEKATTETAETPAH